MGERWAPPVFLGRFLSLPAEKECCESSPVRELFSLPVSRREEAAILAKLSVYNRCSEPIRRFHEDARVHRESVAVQEDILRYAVWFGATRLESHQDVSVASDQRSRHKPLHSSVDTVRSFRVSVRNEIFHRYYYCHQYSSRRQRR